MNLITNNQNPVGEKPTGRLDSITFRVLGTKGKPENGGQARDWEQNGDKPKPNGKVRDGKDN